MDQPTPERRRARDISKFIKHRPKHTQRSYRAVLVKFLDFAFGLQETRRTGQGVKSPADLEYYDGLALQYLNDGRDLYDFTDDLQDFLRENSEMAPMTRKGYKTILNSWLSENHIYLPQHATRRIRTSGRSRTQDRIPAQEELRRIIGHADLQLKAYLLYLSSTGLRPGEGLKILWSDVDLERGVIHVRAEVAKNREPRTTFLSLEAMEVLREWRAYHSQYIEKIDAVTTQPGYLRDHDLVFPLTYSSLRNKYARVLEKAGLDECDPSTGWSQIHPHTLRKYYRTRLPMGGCPIDVVEMLMGHTGYLANSYVRLTEADLESAYRKAEHELWVYRTKPINQQELKQLEHENRELRGELDQIQRRITEMDAALATARASPRFQEILAALTEK